MQVPEAGSPEFEIMSKRMDEQFNNVVTIIVRKHKLPRLFTYASYDPEYSAVVSGVFKQFYTNNGVYLKGENLRMLLGGQEEVLKVFNKFAERCSDSFLICDVCFLEILLSASSVVVWRERGDYRLIGNGKEMLHVLCPSENSLSEEINFPTSNPGLN